MRLSFRDLARLCAPTLLFFVIAETAARYHFQGVYSPLQPDEILNHVWRPNETRMVGEFVSKGLQPYKRVINAQSWLAPYNFARTKPEGSEAKPLPAAKADFGLLFNCNDGEKS